MEEAIEKILAVREQLETLVIQAKDQNTLTVYGCRQILQGVANDLTELLNAQKRMRQAVQGETGSAEE